MSQCGKTTFAKTLPLKYLCFDAFFDWHKLETFPELSIEQVLKHISFLCEKEENYCLDGWYLGGELFLPKDCTLCILYDTHENIIERYSVPIIAEDKHYAMYKKWYNIDFDTIDRPKKYVKVVGKEYKETSREEFEECVGV